MNSKEACLELLGANVQTYLGESSHIRPYAEPLVSWPDIGDNARLLSSRLDTNGRALIEGRRPGLVRPKAGFLRLRREDGVPVFIRTPLCVQAPRLILSLRSRRYRAECADTENHAEAKSGYCLSNRKMVVY